MSPIDHNEDPIFKTGTTISDPVSWLGSILRQLRERREDRDAAPSMPITAAPDPDAIQKFIVTPSPFSSLLSTLRGIRNDRHNPHRLETTATPVEVEELWSKDNSGYSGLISVGLHGVLVLLALIPAAAALQPPPTVTSVTMLAPPLVIPVPPNKARSGGGGGGGMKTPTPPSKGLPPRGADKQLAPPMPEIKNLNPDLIVEPTIVAPQLASMPQLPIMQFGDPNGVVGPPSAGPGTGGGIGTGDGRGVGSGRGPGLGPGEGGGVGGGAFSVGGGVSEPVLTYQLQPEYSDDGRRARIQGTVELIIIVNADGTVKFDSVRKSLGYGLDQKAIDAVKRWKFIAGKKDGAPVPTWVSVLVNFSLR